MFYAWFIHVQELSSQILFYAIMVLAHAGRNEVVVEITLHVRGTSPGALLCAPGGTRFFFTNGLDAYIGGVNAFAYV